MAKTARSGQVPKAMAETFAAIVALTDDFSRRHLNEEYARLIRRATAALCRKRPSPLGTGKPDSWACGITHAIGATNFLFDPSQTPTLPALELYRAFGVSQSNALAKSRQVRDILGMSPLNLEWQLASRVDKKPLAWMIRVNGLIIDARQAPREIQEIAFEKGLIPYIPADKKEFDDKQ